MKYLKTIFYLKLTKLFLSRVKGLLNLIKVAEEKVKVLSQLDFYSLILGVIGNTGEIDMGSLYRFWKAASIYSGMHRITWSTLPQKV